VAFPQVRPPFTLDVSALGERPYLVPCWNQLSVLSPLHRQSARWGVNDVPVFLGFSPSLLFSPSLPPPLPCDVRNCRRPGDLPIEVLHLCPSFPCSRLPRFFFSCFVSLQTHGTQSSGKDFSRSCLLDWLLSVLFLSPYSFFQLLPPM